MSVDVTSAVLDAVSRASQRSRAVVYEELKGGIYDLATIASIAPWIGIYGTVVGIVDSFQGLSAPMWTVRAAICENLARAMVFTALGLLRVS